MVANCTAKPPKETKKLDSIHRESIRIFTGAFTMSPVESLHVEAYDPPLELRRNAVILV